MIRRVFVLAVLLISTAAYAQKRLVIIDQDGSGPADASSMMSILALLQSPEVEVRGITVVTGDAWRDEEVQHTLRMLELTGHANVPVVPGAVFPLVRTQDESRLAAQLHGKPVWEGAWGGREDVALPAGAAADASFLKGSHGPWDVPPLAEGAPKTKPLDEDAAHFLVREVRARPQQIAIVALGPLTNIALAIAIEPRFAELTRGIAIMGSSINPQTDDPEFATSPRFEFNFWFDPEAVHKVLRAHWPRIDVTTVDVSIKTMFTDDMFNAIGRSDAPAAQYIAKYTSGRYYMWDELAACAWLDPTIITKTRDVYMDVDLSHGPDYGNTLTWPKELKPALDLQLVHAQLDVDLPKFRSMFVRLMTR
ncbi:MAG TPA: nucleoside hydrolase [Thermoanaerobaculia bacterium]|nr:nucleoside hydrolase [Thermoanaerobaculia bacterium]